MCCDIVLTMYKVDNKSACKENEATYDEIAKTGEMFVVRHLTTYIFIAHANDEENLTMLKERNPRLLPHLNSHLQLHNTKYLCYARVVGNSLQATSWFCKCISLNDDILSPIYTDRPAAPDSVLSVTRAVHTVWWCKTGCSWSGLDGHVAFLTYECTLDSDSE